ncbi:hypothetical protein QFZ76_003605 [Streptomyces sp. V4I2]|nr:hypothetical protein [Streptomyces sp. V4I2]
MLSGRSPSIIRISRRSAVAAISDGGMFDTYAESFDAVWTTATPVREEG